MPITMTAMDVIDRVAAETDLEPEAVERVVAALAAHNGHAEAGAAELIEALMPVPLAVPTPAAVLQARRNAEARTALLREFGALRSAEVAELAGSRAGNRAALANRWRSEGPGAGGGCGRRAAVPRISVHLRRADRTRPSRRRCGYCGRRPG